MAASWHALLVVAAIPPLSLSLSLLIFLDLKTEITCGRDYSRFSVFSHVLQKERVVAAIRIVLGKVWFKLFYQRPDLHWLYSIHHVFELALTSPNEMLSGTRLAHGRSAIHCEGRSHWAIPSAAPAGSKTWLTWLYFHLHSRQEIEITKRGLPPALLRPWAFHVNALPSSAAKPRYSMQDTWISGAEGTDWFWFFFMFHHATFLTNCSQLMCCKKNRI